MSPPVLLDRSGKEAERALNKKGSGTLFWGRRMMLLYALCQWLGLCWFEKSIVTFCPPHTQQGEPGQRPRFSEANRGRRGGRSQGTWLLEKGPFDRPFEDACIGSGLG
jgi:hypothetical protein